MKVCTLIIFALTTAIISLSECKKCKTEVAKVEECSTTEYKSYLECVRRRMKRSTSCEEGDESCEDCSEEECDDCDCGECERHGCEYTCSRCCNTEVRCRSIGCCHKKCHSQCRTYSCRKSCRKSCTSKISTVKETVYKTEGSSPRHNITTIINLKNTINTTNLIDIPILLNNTNVNNITVNGELKYGGTDNVISHPHHHHHHQQQHHECCHVISPRQCVPISTYPFARCFHLRHRKCGDFCSAPIVHEQPHEICDVEADNSPKCHQQVVYIPQPQPRCSYTSVWPYVQCGIQSSTNCAGCYTKEKSSHCHSSCYDYSFDGGPRYPKGPMYPSNCFQTGSCVFGNFAYAGGMPIGFGLPGMGAPGYNGQGMGIPGLGYSPQVYESNYLIETDSSKLHNVTSGNIIEEPVPLTGFAGYNLFDSGKNYGMPEESVLNVLPPNPHYEPRPMVSIQTSRNAIGYRSQAEIQIETNKENTTEVATTEEHEDV